MIAEVCHGFEGEHLSVENYELERGKKRAKKDHLDVFGGALHKRQKVWLDKDDEDIEEQTWRPVTLHRQGGRRWIWHCDNIIKHSIHQESIQNLFDALREMWSHWSKCPWASIARDLGSDGVFGVHYLLYKADANVDFAGG